ncbi:hypothetical protein H6F75_00110 [Nodosilinea sp. FACHB-131]|uniref:hypothetical protein n=1 Tax=Cyanophyceae TaxID=3028117 RepID=UPI00168212E1|nr:hypothetical protein [Nodosilinea sp. FACHB-131]MBD1871873.1 hypothetical protein [Nodosilinea sp. FACHB-131]
MSHCLATFPIAANKHTLYPEDESRHSAAVIGAVRSAVRKYHAGFSTLALVRMAQSGGTTEDERKVGAVVAGAVKKARLGYRMT